MFSALFVQSPHSSSIFLLSARILAIWQHLFSGAVIKPIDATLASFSPSVEQKLGKCFSACYSATLHISLLLPRATAHTPSSNPILEKTEKMHFLEEWNFCWDFPHAHCRRLKGFGFVGPGGDITRSLPLRGCTGIVKRMVPRLRDSRVLASSGRGGAFNAT